MRGMFAPMPCYPILAALSDDAPVPGKRPVNKEPAPDQVRFRHGTPPPAVVAIVAVVPHREVTLFGHLVSLRRVRQIIAARRVTSIRRFRGHHPAKAKAFDDITVYMENG